MENTDKGKKASGRKPGGYWNDPANVITEARAVVEQHGTEALVDSWLAANGYGGLANAISKNGGYYWIKAELELEQGRRPSGYWTKENVLKEAKQIVREFGEEKISYSWLAKNGKRDLAYAITKCGGIAWLRSQLGLAEARKPNGYWTEQNTLAEAGRVLGEFGEDAITCRWLQAASRCGLRDAIISHGGFARIRKELGLTEGRKPRDYWSPENTAKEARQVLEDCGEEAINIHWLGRNQKTGLRDAIHKNGGIPWIRKELGLGNGRKDRDYWTKENTIKEARQIFAEHGEVSISQAWLERNRRCDLLGAVSKNGGILWLKNELGLPESRKPPDYWSLENTVKEARQVLREFGDNTISTTWLWGNGRHDLAGAIQKHGGFSWIRAELGIEPPAKSTHKSSTPAQRRSINIERLKRTLLDLQQEGVHGLTPSQLVILLQQGGFDKLPMAEGRDLFIAVTKGSLAPKALFGWSEGDEPEPPTEGSTTAPGPEGPEPAAPVEPVSTTPAAPIEPAELPADAPAAPPAQPEVPVPEEDSAGTTAEPIQPVAPAEPGEPVEIPDQLPALAIQDAEEQLRYLDCEVFAAADEEAIEALTSIALHQIWAKAYGSPAEEAKTAEACRTYSAKRPWTNRLQQEFLRQHAGARVIQLPASYSFTVEGQRVEPRLMQRHVAFMAHERRRLLVLSDMGTGKSLAAQLAAMTDGAKRILVLPINACGHQWASDFRHQWAGVQVHDDLGRCLDHSGRKSLVLPETSTAGGADVWVVPIHLLSLMDDQDVFDLVDGFQPDAVILDEVQFLKQRHDEQESARRRQAAKVLCLATEANPEALVLALSGTAVVNNLVEAKKLLELTLCEERPDLSTTASVANAMRMHQALMANGIRQQARNQFPIEIRRPEVDATDWTEQVKFANRYPARQRPLMVEKVLVEARIPAVVKAINGPTVVATQYVEGFIEPLREAIEAAGYSVGVHTGNEQLPVHGHLNAIEAFKAGAVDVLLASINTLGTGVDGLQRVSSNLVIASMPWTAADYLQLIARLARSGQKELVVVTIPTTAIDYWDEEEGLSRWSFCDYRAAVIATKQRLMDAVMDGLIPDDEEITEAKAGHQLAQWIKRLGTTGALVRHHRPITVPLVFTTEVEELRARRHYGDWSGCNGRWNSTSSSALHNRLQRNPQEWELYHTDLEKLRLQWPVDPLQEAIDWCAKSSGLVIGDFGCGTAQLAEALRGRHTVHSFDHIAINDSVVACDIAAGVPLEDGCLDLAIFSLSLMGPNWGDQLSEAHRCLKPTGQVLIWTAGSGKDPEAFTAQVEERGFKAVRSELHSKWLHLWAVRSETKVRQANTTPA